MGPGFGNDLGKSMLAALIILVVGVVGVTITLWEFAKWIFRHLSVGWN